MILFYVIDAVAIYAVLKQHRHDSDAGVCLKIVSLPSKCVLHKRAARAGMIECPGVCVTGKCCQEHRHISQKDVAAAVSSFQADPVG